MTLDNCTYKEVIIMHDNFRKENELLHKVTKKSFMAIHKESKLRLLNVVKTFKESIVRQLLAYQGDLSTVPTIETTRVDLQNSGYYETTVHMLIIQGHKVYIVETINTDKLARKSTKYNCIVYIQRGTK